MNLNSIFTRFGIPASFAQDFTLLLVVVLVSFIFGMFIGRARLITVLINIYISVALLSAVPEKYLINSSQKLLFFLVAVTILTILGKKLFEINLSGAGSGFLWRVFVLSFLEVGLLASVILSFMAKKEALGYVSQTAFAYLATPEARFIWMALPLAFILIIHKRLNR